MKLRRLLVIAALLLVAVPVVSTSAATPLFRADHTVLSGGQPFFPLAIYGMDRDAASLAEVRDAGFNTVGVLEPEAPSATRSWMDTLQANGLKGWVRGANGLALEDAATSPSAPVVEQQIRAQVRELRDHPALLWWEVGDEPGWNGVPAADLARGQAVLREEDPNHALAMTEFHNEGLMAPYVGIADIAGTWRYPDATGGFASHDVKRSPYIDGVKNVRGDRPLQFALPGWSWDPIVTDWQNSYPTPEQSRFMAYQAVIQGAKALSWFGKLRTAAKATAYSLPPAAKDTPENFALARERNAWFWERTKPVIREVRASTRFFVLPEASAARRVAVSDAAIQATTKDDGGSTLRLLSVNASDAARTVDFQLPAGVSASQVTVEYENRTVPVDGSGRFTDTFAGLGTHVYSINPTAPPATASLFSASATPTAAYTGPGGVEVGVRFRSDVAGTVTALRFYKGASSTGTHVGHLWSATGQLLATATFTGETASGWQQVSLSTPVAITANAIYVASYFTTSGYSYTPGGFSNGVDAPPLHAPADTNGVYRVGNSSGFPTQSYEARNYFVDVVVNAGGTAPPTTTSTTTTTTTTSSTTTTTAPPSGACPCRLFPASTTPTAAYTGPGGVEVGVRLRSDAAGTVTALRFYKGASSTGTHVGHLWSATGQLLATATFTGETASGWQQVSLSAPVAITANTIYVASYFTTSGYSYTPGGFSSAVDAPPLHAPADTNGVYRVGNSSGFPTQSYEARNYFVDVVVAS